MRQRIFCAGFVFLPVALLCGSGVSAQIRKSCGDAMYLKLTAASALQGTLVQTQVSSTKALPQGVSAQWDGKASPVWHEAGASKTLHGMIGIDLEKPRGATNTRLRGKMRRDRKSPAPLRLPSGAGKFPTEHLKVEKQFVQPDPEQQKRAEDDSKKMRAIYDTVTPGTFVEGRVSHAVEGDRYRGELWTATGAERCGAFSARRRGFSRAYRNCGVCTTGGQSGAGRRSLLFREYGCDRSWFRNLYVVRASFAVRGARGGFRGGWDGNWEGGSDRAGYRAAPSLGIDD